MAVEQKKIKHAVVKPGKLFIGGEWRDAVSGKTFETVNPATGDVITHVAEADAPDIDLAVQAARKAFEEGPWGRLTAHDRGRIVWRIGDLIEEHADELAELEVLDTGKPIREARYIDIPMAANCFRYYGGWTTKIEGETIPVAGPFFNYTVREPMGVVGQIIPWNFPLLMAAWKVAPALACGNTVVLKPAEQTPLSALRLGELCQEAGVPDGVVNIVPGFGPTAGAALVKHPEVNKIAFTGEVATGQEIMRNAAETLKPISLELGGKSPNIVFADADLDAAVKGAIMGIYFNQGECCAAGSRLFVQDNIHDEFMEKLVQRARTLRQGDPFDPETQIGALISEEHMNKVMGYIELGRREGAKLVAGGQRLGEKGYFVRPTVFDEVDNAMRIAQEEIFGPVVAVIPFKDVDDVVQKSNAVIYGLAAAVWTRDIKKAHTLARQLKAGTVWINTYNVLDTTSPFGGYKMSGFGRELGRYALDLYTQVKSVWVDLS
ncbi:MAG: betaine-aldehyde dehydrogenase [Acidobacteria bacterium]|nr:MAG: betaine-aldehyde dehydrogenase [Acidobacteriota bacterium]